MSDWEDMMSTQAFYQEWVEDTDFVRQRRTLLRQRKKLSEKDPVVPSFTFILRCSKKEGVQESELEHEDNSAFVINFLAGFAHSLPNESEMKAALTWVSEHFALNKFDNHAAHVAWASVEAGLQKSFMSYALLRFQKNPSARSTKSKMHQIKEVIRQKLEAEGMLTAEGKKRATRGPSASKLEDPDPGNAEHGEDVPEHAPGENDVPVGFLDNIETLPMELGSIEVPMETPEEEIEEVDDEVEISEALDQVTTVVATEKPDVVPEDPAFWTDSQIPEEMFAEEPLPPLEPVGEEEVPEKQEGSVPVAEESSEQTPDEAGSDPTTTTATGPESERRAKEERAKEEPEDVEVVESDEGEGEREAKGTFKDRKPLRESEPSHNEKIVDKCVVLMKELFKTRGLPCEAADLLEAANGGALIILCEELGFYGGGAFQVQLDAAYAAFRSFCTSMKIHHSCPPWTEKLVKKKDGNILMTCKAFNARCVMEFLAHELRTAVDSGMHPNNDRLELASVCMTSMARVQFLIESSGRRLPATVAQKIWKDGMLFLDTYKCLQILSVRQSKHTFLLRPKHHMFAHLLWDALLTRSNWRFFHTYIDEDSMGWLKRVGGGTHFKNRPRWTLRVARLRMRSMKHRIRRLMSSSDQRPLQ